MVLNCWCICFFVIVGMETQRQ